MPSVWVLMSNDSRYRLLLLRFLLTALSNEMLSGRKGSFFSLTYVYMHNLFSRKQVRTVIRLRCACSKIKPPATLPVGSKVTRVVWASRKVHDLSSWPRYLSV